MASIPLSCPHCLTEKAAFTLVASHPRIPNTVDYIVLLQCGVCGNGVVGHFVGHNFIPWFQNRSPKGDVEMKGIWPSPNANKSPSHLPPNVESFYLQAMDSMARHNFDAAGTMFRKSLDTALKKLHPEGKGALYTRIEQLPPEIGVTPAMKQWAHEIRELGNDAAHEDEPFTETEAQALQAFTELLLTYAFALPGMLEDRKPKATPPKA